MHYHNLKGGSIIALIANNRVNSADAPLQSLLPLLQRLSVITSRHFAAATLQPPLILPNEPAGNCKIAERHNKHTIITNESGLFRQREVRKDSKI